MQRLWSGQASSLLSQSCQSWSSSLIVIVTYTNFFCLVAFRHPSEKYDFVNWDDNRFPILMGKCQIHGNQTTNQYLSYIYHGQMIFIIYLPYINHILTIYLPNDSNQMIFRPYDISSSQAESTVAPWRQQRRRRRGAITVPRALPDLARCAAEMAMRSEFMPTLGGSWCWIQRDFSIFL